MKIKKGEYGYINLQKKKYILKLLITIVIAIAFLGVTLFIDKTFIKYCYVLAALCSLPFAQFVVELVVIAKFSSQPRERYSDITNYLSNSCVLASDMMISTKERIYNFPFIMISQGNVYAYITIPKDKEKSEFVLRDLITRQGYTESEVLVYVTYDEFIKKVEVLKKVKLAPCKSDEEIKTIYLLNSL